MSSIANTADNSSERPDLDATMHAALAAGRARHKALAVRAAETTLLHEPDRTHTIATYAAELLAPTPDALAWDAHIGTGLDTSDGIASVKLAFDDEHFALLDPDEAFRLATRVLGLALTAKAAER